MVLMLVRIYIEREGSCSESAAILPFFEEARLTVALIRGGFLKYQAAWLRILLTGPVRAYPARHNTNTKYLFQSLVMFADRLALGLFSK